MHTFGETGTGVPAFLAKLWRLVEDTENNNLIYWSSDGRSFIIQNQAQFAREVLPQNYKHNNMASFIRQLNMYGFHKITSIENGGLKFDKDEMEFSHPCFQRGHPYLLEHIKRKIAHPKAMEEKNNIKPEAVSKVLNEVKLMKGRQESLDSRFSTMKQENEALWREIVMLRQKHMKQQQIVNKLIQFLVTIVQPTRSGLGTMSGGKRRFQLMINDAPQSSKMKKPNNADIEGPVIHEIGEDFFDEVYDENESEMPTEPYIETASSEVNKSPYLISNNPALIAEIPNANDYFDNINIETDDGTSTVTLQESDDDVAYTSTNTNEIENNSLYNEENVIKTPMVKQELGENKKISRGKRSKKRTSTLTIPNKNSKKGVVNVKQEIQPIETIDPNEFLNFQGDTTDSVADDEEIPKNSKPPTWYTNKDFISADIPNDLFDEQTASQQVGNSSSAPSLVSNMNLSEGSYNPTLSEDVSKRIEEMSAQNSKDLTVAKLNIRKISDDDIYNLHTPEDIDNHLENVQEDLDSLKDILKNDGYTLDANALLGSSTGGENNINRLYLSPSVDTDFMAKLFGDSDILQPYMFPAGGEYLDERRQNDSSSSVDTKLMAYQPCNVDLSELLSAEDESLIDQDENSSGPSELNTPVHEKEIFPTMK